MEEALRDRPIESISSMKTMEGAASAAYKSARTEHKVTIDSVAREGEREGGRIEHYHTCLNSLRTRAGPRPTNTSTKSLAEQAKNGT